MGATHCLAFFDHFFPLFTMHDILIIPAGLTLQFIVLVALSFYQCWAGVSGCLFFLFLLRLMDDDEWVYV